MSVTRRDVDRFEAARPRLQAIAYRLLGTTGDAEDAVQETFLRWQRHDAMTIEVPKAWLVATITRLAIDQLRSARRRREDYVGVWLPEPIVDETAPAPDARAALADSLGVAFLFLLETLGPTERAVFLLREVFAYDYEAIAEIVGKSEANCRQLMSRAKRQLAQREPAPSTPMREAEELVRRFLAACTTGQVGELLAVLAEDAVLYSDGGGRVRAAIRPIMGAQRISRFYAGLHERAFAGAQVELAKVNGEVGGVMRGRDGKVSVMAFAVQGNRIRAVYVVMNPEKLGRVGRRWESEGPE